MYYCQVARTKQGSQDKLNVGRPLFNQNLLCGSLAQLGEHLPYKQRVIGSSPIVSTNGLVVQLVRTPPCHGGGRGFESHPGRHLCGFSSSGRAPPCQGGGSEFEPRNPLQKIRRGNIHGVFAFLRIIFRTAF